MTPILLKCSVDTVQSLVCTVLSGRCTKCVVHSSVATPILLKFPLLPFIHRYGDTDPAKVMGALVKLLCNGLCALCSVAGVQCVNSCEQLCTMCVQLCTSGCVMTVIREMGAVIIVVHTNWQIVQDQTTHWIRPHRIRPHWSRPHIR